MRDELDEGLAHEFSTFRVRCQDVLQAVDGEAAAQLDDINELLGRLFASKARQTLIPNGGEQLLNVWMCHKLKWEQQLEYMAYDR